MASQPQHLTPSHVVDHICDVLLEIMQVHGIAPPTTRPYHVIPADASFQQVVQYTYDWYCVLRGRDQPHYRYRRYREVFGNPNPPSNDSSRLAHVDMGCGAGLFSWALLDWAIDSNLSHQRIDLYGLDHSAAMIALAHMARDRLATKFASYPQLHYETNAQMLLQALTEGHHDDTSYVVTFGHVLVQAHSPDAILSFNRVIAHILSLLSVQSHCWLVAVDARRRPESFAEGWNALLDSLPHLGVRYELGNVGITAINDPGCVKIARLLPPEM